MQTFTRNAMNEIDREKDQTPEEILVFLRERDNFLSVSDGIKRELNQLGYTTNDDQLLLKDFKNLLKEAGFTADQRKNAATWLIKGKLPSPRKNFPIRLCFAFKLKGKDALDFLWKVCRVNGFNFRKAEDIVFCYCLEHGKNYAEAIEIIKKYKGHTADKQQKETDATKRTRTIRAIFNDLKNLDESTFFELLCANKNNFIGYSETAHDEYVKLYSKLKEKIMVDMEEYNHFLKYVDIEGYNSGISMYLEIVFAFDKIAKSISSSNTPFGSIMVNFPQSEYLTKMYKSVTAATDKEHDKARKVFLLLFFANYALELPPDSFFNDFIFAANELLDRCGYAKLYAANPYDWLILSCIKSLDVTDPLENTSPLELFNDVLELLASESNEEVQDD